MLNPVNLIILTSHANEADGLVTTLRNGGLPAHGRYTQHPQRLAELAANHPCDLILCCVYDPKIDLQETLAHHKALDRDIPLVLIADDQTPRETLIQAMRSGARDLTERNDPSHLQLVVAREYGDLQQRRTLTQMREQLEHCEQRARDLIEDLDDACASIQQGIHVSANRAYRALFGFSAVEDLDGYPVLDMVALTHRAGAKAFLRGVEAGDHEGPNSLDLVCVRLDGSRFDAELAATRGEIDDEPCLQVTVRLKETAGREAAAMDADTGLPSRAALMQELSRRLAAGSGGPLALIVLRIIGLERVAQGEGLSAAFKLATQVAASLGRAIPEGGLLARLGDDAFALVVQPAEPARAQAIAAELCQTGRQPLRTGAEGEMTTTCIAGLALAGPKDASVTLLLDRAFHDSETQRVREAPPAIAARPAPADAAITPRPPEAPAAAASPVGASVPAKPQAAKPGKSGEAAPDPQIMAALVREALGGTGKAELRLVYQPIVSLMGDSQENYSVLVRLLDPDQRLHEAKEFIAAATAAGLVAEIDHWVIHHAIAELAAQRANGHKLNFFINIAEETIQNEELIIWICDRLREFDARGSWLTFQFPEDEASRSLAALTRLVDGLEKIKCRIALTRCGQRNNPQMLMQSLPLDFLMFAQDFARGLAEDKVKQQQLMAFANLAQEFNVKSIVTGVEDARALTVLWTAGIDYVQGNFLQRPSPSLEVHG